MVFFIFLNFFLRKFRHCALKTQTSIFRSPHRLKISVFVLVEEKVAFRLILTVLDIAAELLFVLFEENSYLVDVAVGCSDFG